MLVERRIFFVLEFIGGCGKKSVLVGEFKISFFLRYMFGCKN